MSNATFLQLQLFDEQPAKVEKQKSKKEVFEDYDSFVEKFVPKKTTDDCYTPPAVYDAVVNYVKTLYDLDGLQIARPFYPGGNFEAFDYPDNAIVIDNPPFSIVTKIVRYYVENSIKFFIFAPHLTLLVSTTHGATAIVCGAVVIYENGAEVKTSFWTNLTPNLKVLAAPELYDEIKRIHEDGKVALPKYEYPANVLTVSMVQKWVERGISFKLEAKDGVHCRALDSQRPLKKGVFGTGLLISDKAAADKAAADKAAADKAAADKAAADKAAADKDNVIVWGLSKRELDIIESMEDLC